MIVYESPIGQMCFLQVHHDIKRVYKLQALWGRLAH